MRVVLIIPWDPDEVGVKWNSDYQRLAWRNANYGVVQLATFVRDLGHEILVIDTERDLLVEAHADPALLLSQLERLVLRFEPDVVGVTGMSCRYPAIDAILNRLAPHSARQGFHLICGGAHASGVPEHLLREHPELDCVFYGEGELSLVAFLSHLSGSESSARRLEAVPGICYRGTRSVVCTAVADPLEMDRVPFPDWDLIDVDFYLGPCVWLHRSLVTLVRNLDTIASRGCRYRCRYCAMSMNRGRPRTASVDGIMAYIEQLRCDYRITATMFQDSSLANDREFLWRLCEAFISLGPRRSLFWNANIRADQVEEDLLRHMYRAGCRMVFIGFESGSDRVLAAMRKGTTVADNAKAVEMLRRVKMPYWASFIAGYPGETEHDLKASIEFARKLDPIGGWANEFNPAPGCKTFNQLINDGTLDPPTTPEGWARISKIGQEGPVREGRWADMPSTTFRALTDQFQALLQARLDQGMQRELEPLGAQIP